MMPMDRRATTTAAEGTGVIPRGQQPQGGRQDTDDSITADDLPF